MIYIMSAFFLRPVGHSLSPSRSSPCFPSKNRFDGCFEDLPPGQAHELPLNPALTVDKEGRRNSLDLTEPGKSAVSLKYFFAPHHIDIFNAFSVQKPLDFPGADAIERDPDYREPLISIFPEQFIQVGNPLLAGGAPGGPEIQNDNLSAEVRQMDLFSVQGGQGEEGSGYPLSGGRNLRISFRKS